MEIERLFYKVTDKITDAPLEDHLFHGYEEREDFEYAIQRILDTWRGHIGEALERKRDFVLLRFHDTPVGRPEELWLPLYLLTQVPMPEYLYRQEHPDVIRIALEKLHNFD